MSFNKVTYAFQKLKNMNPQMLQSIEINERTAANGMEFWINKIKVKTSISLFAR